MKLVLMTILSSFIALPAFAALDVQTVLQANHGAVSDANDCQVKIFAPGEFTPGPRMWMQVFSPAGESEISYPGVGGVWTLDAATTTISFVVTGGSPSVQSYFTLSYDPNTLKFTGLVDHYNSGGASCAF